MIQNAPKRNHKAHNSLESERKSGAVRRATSSFLLVPFLLLHQKKIKTASDLGDSESHLPKLLQVDGICDACD